MLDSLKAIIGRSHGVLLAAFLVLSVFALVDLAPATAHAQLAMIPNGGCTNDGSFDPEITDPSEGLVTTIVENVQDILYSVTFSMYSSIAWNGGFADAATAMVDLYVILYGVLFTFGMVQITLFDFAVRMIKIGIISKLIGPDSWNFFYNHVVVFFNDTTDEIIGKVSSVAVDGISYSFNPDDVSAYPFSVLDGAIGMATSAKLAVTIIATFVTGPYGVIYGLLILMSIGIFFKSLVNALWVYIMSLVLKTLLFGLAPIFICFLLFNRTRHLFDGWLNMVVGATLQPILLFTFFAFFARLIEAALNKLTMNPVCWNPVSETVRGSPFSQHFWRFAKWDGGAWVPMDTPWDFRGGYANGPIFPMDIFTVLALLILAEICSRFNSIVIEIAKDLAGSATDLRMGGESIAQWFSAPKGDEGGAAGGPGANARRLGRMDGGGNPLNPPGPGGVMARANAGGGVGRPGGAPAAPVIMAGGRDPVGGARRAAEAMTGVRPGGPEGIA